MAQLMQVADMFRLKQGNLVIVGAYTLDNARTKIDIASKVGDMIKVINPFGCEIKIKVISIDLSTSLIGAVNLAIELPAETNGNDIAIGSVIIVI